MAKINGIHVGDFPGTFKDYGGILPMYYLLCDGSVVSQATYPALFLRIGTAFNTGGEGVGNFRLPDSRRRVHVGSGGSGSVTLGNAVGNSGGEESHLLTSGESGMPSHGHTVNDPTHSHALSDSNIRVYDGPTVTATNNGATHAINPGSVSVNSASTGISINSASASNAASAHNTLQPSLVVTKMIRY